MLRDIRHTLLRWRKAPSFAIIGLFTLALGIGANTAVFSFVNALLLRPLPFAEPDRLVTIRSVRGGEAGKLMPREWEEIDRDKSAVESAAAWYTSQYNLTSDGPPEAVTALMTTGNLFQVLGVRPLYGDAWPLDFYKDRHPVVVLSHGLWQRRFGSDARIVHTTIVMDVSPYEVYGVAPPGFEFPARFDVYRAAILLSPQNQDSRSVWVVARLQRGVSIREAQSRLDALAQRFEHQYPDTNRGIGFRLAPLRDLYVGEARPYVLMSIALVAVVLLLACSNVVHLLLMRSVERRQELAIQLALGAGHFTIFRQLLTETLMLAGGGAVLGLAMSAWWTRLLRTLIRVDLPQWATFEIDARVLLFALAAALLAAVLAGMAPAISLSGVNLIAGLQSSSRGASSGRSQRKIRRILVIAEVSLAALLLGMSGLLVRSFTRLMEIDTGFTSAPLLTFRADPPFTKYNALDQTAPFYKRALERLSVLPGVEAAAANHNLPIAGNDNYGKPAILIEGQSADEQRLNPYANVQIVSPNYLEVMDIPIVSGRSFSADDRTDTVAAAVISRPLASRLFGAVDPIGRRIRFTGLVSATQESQKAWFTIIGVSEGVRSENLMAGLSMDIYLSNQQQFAGDSYFILRTRTAPEALAGSISRAVREVDPEQSIFDVKTMERRLTDTVWQRRIAGTLSLLFAGLALSLATAGVYSILSYAARTRTREFGVRLALGATPLRIRCLILREGLSLTLVGVALGMAGSFAISRQIRNMLYETGFLEPLQLLATPVVLIAVALFACYIPARRAESVDPVEALRN
jgi:predicted permease